MPRAIALDAILSTPWAIKPEWLRTITDIAMRQGEGPEALQARMGRPLDNARSVTVRDGVAIVPVTGPIFPRANMMTEMSGATSLALLATDLRAALDDPNVSAVVIDIDSPGGVAFGVQEMADMVYAARQEKPVVAYVSGMAASAAYWLASAAGEVVINASGLAGSIGVVMGMQIQEGPDQNGYRDIELVSSHAPNKRPDPRTDEGLAEIQTLLDGLEAEFIGAVARNRGVSADAVVKQFGAGGIKVGIGAVNAGMADRVGTMEQVLAELAARRENTQVAYAARQQSMEDDMDPKTLTAEQLKAERPDLVAAIEKDATASLKAEHETALTATATASAAGAADAERARILGIQAHSEPGAEALVADMVADGKTTPDQAAGRVLAAQKERRAGALDDLLADDTGTAVKPSGDRGGDGKPAIAKDPKALAHAATKLIRAEAAEGNRISSDEAVARVLAGEAA